MANIIAVIWDCDKTLIDGYMQDPIFKDYNINASDFWKEVNSKPDEYKKKGIRVNKDTYYLNHFIKCAHDGTLKGLNNAKLKEYGKKQKCERNRDYYRCTKCSTELQRPYLSYGV